MYGIINWSAQVIEDPVAKRSLDTKDVTYKVRNLWTMKDLGNTKKSLKVTVAPRDVVMLRLSKA